MKTNNLFDNIFCIPNGDRFIIYFPLQRFIVEGNDKFVNLLNKAKEGDQSARSELGLEKYLEEEARRADYRSGEIRSHRGISEFKPTSVSLFLTSDCNLCCGYCYANGGARNTRMPWDMAENILNIVSVNAASTPAKGITVHFHGGGDVSTAWPLLVRTREYLESLERKYGLKLKTTLGINGVLGKAQRKWVIANIGSATVSMDGPPEIQNNQRPLKNGGASFPFVYDTIKAFDEASFPYAMRVTVTKQSVMKLREIVTYFCKHFNVKEIKAEPMFPSGRALESDFDPPDPEVFVEQYRQASKIAEQFNRKLSYSGARFDVLTDVFCQAAGNSFAVTPEGWVTSCYEVLSKDDPLSETFFYGFYDSDTKEIRIDEDHRDNLKKFSVWHKPYCMKCFCKWHCAGDCPAKAIQSDDNGTTGISDRCYINRELTKDQIIKALKGDS